MQSEIRVKFLPEHLDTSRFMEYVDVGHKDMYWYQKCQTFFDQMFGSDKTPLICKLFAATSINTSLKSNVTLFRKALYEIENGLPIGKYLPNIQNQLQLIRDGLPLSGRKINSFAKAMGGDVNAVVVDIWLLRAFNLDRKCLRKTGPHAGLMRSGGPTDRQYTIIENYCRDQAVVLGLEPRQVSSMLW